VATSYARVFKMARRVGGGHSDQPWGLAHKPRATFCNEKGDDACLHSLILPHKITSFRSTRRHTSPVSPSASHTQAQTMPTYSAAGATSTRIGRPQPIHSSTTSADQQPAVRPPASCRSPWPAPGAHACAGCAPHPTGVSADTKAYPRHQARSEIFLSSAHNGQDGHFTHMHTRHAKDCHAACTSIAASGLKPAFARSVSERRSASSSCVLSRGRQSRTSYAKSPRWNTISAIDCIGASDLMNSALLSKGGPVQVSRLTSFSSRVPVPQVSEECLSIQCAISWASVVASSSASYSRNRIFPVLMTTCGKESNTKPNASEGRLRGRRDCEAKLTLPPRWQYAAAARCDTGQTWNRCCDQAEPRVGCRSMTGDVTYPQAWYQPRLRVPIGKGPSCRWPPAGVTSDAARIGLAGAERH
jgi:hypothetical protein